MPVDNADCTDTTSMISGAYGVQNDCGRVDSVATHPCESGSGGYRLPRKDSAVFALSLAIRSTALCMVQHVS